MFLKAIQWLFEIEKISLTLYAPRLALVLIIGALVLLVVCYILQLVWMIAMAFAPEDAFETEE